MSLQGRAKHNKKQQSEEKENMTNQMSFFETGIQKICLALTITSERLSSAPCLTDLLLLAVISALLNFYTLSLR